MAATSSNNKTEEPRVTDSMWDMKGMTLGFAQVALKQLETKASWMREWWNVPQDARVNTRKVMHKGEFTLKFT